MITTPHSDSMSIIYRVLRVMIYFFCTSTTDDTVIVSIIRAKIIYNSISLFDPPVVSNAFGRITHPILLLFADGVLLVSDSPFDGVPVGLPVSSSPVGRFESPPAGAIPHSPS